VQLDGIDHRGLYIPRGVAHGFYAITDATITYLVDGYYNPDDELGVKWSDPTMQIEWPGTSPTLSKRDQSNPLIADIPADLVPA
jgi:dTDP-4-dehydrorhamnose 3,5-epimerase